MATNKLNRSIGLLSATSIGLGAMLGAGIFVFPGLAGGQSGPMAVFSFLIGGIIALFVAICTAELATAMPQSGGGYFFISRAFGKYWGTLTGIAQWIGLVFACAFYLLSFSEYVYALLKEMNLSWTWSIKIFAFGFTFILFVINIIGTKKVGKIQNLMVISLAIILVIIFSYGLIDFFGLKDHETAMSAIAPKGISSVFTTTALIFTSFLGFVQIANIGAEIKEPSTNLPKSLIGSVIIATLLYIFIMSATSLTFSLEELKQYGEVATVEVTRKLLGDWGAVITVFAAVLAALSSANASMISASRGVYAISKDKLLSPKASKVNKEFGTPHVSLMLVAIPIGLVLLRDRLEVLAEVASFLHLIIYAGICISVLKLRRSKPGWYAPRFRTPFVKVIAGTGATGCLVLPFFMENTSIYISLGIVALASLYYVFYIRTKQITLETPKPAYLIDKTSFSPKILIPIDVDKDKKDLPHNILDAMPVSKLLLLAFKEIPEQSDVEQSENEFKEEAKKKLESIQSELESSEINWESKIIFVKDINSKIKEIIAEKQLQFILLLKPIAELKRLVIPIYDSTQIRKNLSRTIYNIKKNTQAKIKVLICIEEGDDSIEENKLEENLEQELRALNISIDEHDTKTYEDESIEEFVQKSTQKSDLILWSQAKSTDTDFFINDILEKEPSERATPSIILLNS